MPKPKPIDVTVERLHEVLTYDPATGVFRWKIGRGRAGRGKVAGSLKPSGYIQIFLDGKSRAAHRLAWYYMTGEWPDCEIDHENTIKNDNRFANLRRADRSGNCQNQRTARSNNSNGLLGVRFDKRHKRYWSEICVNGKKHYLGQYATAEDAHSAYVSAKRRLHPFGTL